MSRIPRPVHFGSFFRSLHSAGSASSEQQMILFSSSDISNSMVSITRTITRCSGPQKRQQPKQCRGQWKVEKQKHQHGVEQSKRSAGKSLLFLGFTHSPVYFLVVILVLFSSSSLTKVQGRILFSSSEDEQQRQLQEVQQSVQNGHVTDVLKIKFKRPPPPRTKPYAYEASTSSRSSSTFESKEINEEEESDILDRTCQQVLTVLDGVCSSCKRTIRKAPNPALEAKHIQYGMHLHYWLNCPSTSSVIDEENDQTTPQMQVHDIFSHENTTPDSSATSKKEGNGPFLAMTLLKKYIDKQKRQYVTSLSYSDVSTPNTMEEDNITEDTPSSISSLVDLIDIVEAGHEIVEAEYHGFVPPMPPLYSSSAAGKGSSEKQPNGPDSFKLRQKRQLKGQPEATSMPSNTSFLSSDPNDILYLDGKQSHYDEIHMSEAWQIMKENNGWDNARKCIVHFLDNGYDMNHEDLGEHVWKNPNEDCENDIDDDKNGFVDDCYGYNHANDVGNGPNRRSNLVGASNHGCHVAGTIACNTNNHIGVAGVAGGTGETNGISLMTSVGFGKHGRSGGFAEALIYAADMGARISSHSWGYKDEDYHDSDIWDAMEYLLAHDVLVVVAAGNQNSGKAYYPSYHPNVVAVTASYKNGVRASFSNYGRGVNIAAPGVSIWSTGFSAAERASNPGEGQGQGNNEGKFDDEYLAKSGTSMACPHVTGVLAMGMSLNPAATTSQVKHCLFSTVDKGQDFELQDDESTRNHIYATHGIGVINPPAFLHCLLELQNFDDSTSTPTEDATTEFPSSLATTESTSSPSTMAPDEGASFQCEEDHKCGDCNRIDYGRVGCACSGCKRLVCRQDPYCCNREWDSICADYADQVCTCRFDCADRCLEAHPWDTGCRSCLQCEKAVCGQDSYCCETHWDANCGDLAQSLCQKWFP